ncbi:polysaccharide deacetylase family protein [Cytobacillus spongiae]|jgi:probable sporulation protein (polysaccharide deacetylase family)|uniref:polysaccharide deacetylase family protein n=1 Tax=Cytobacillus spongiae TaxID=2901381 RepID=UPI001F3AF668|nr:polysaccharide deacetylase family protein [Cytobacillus spongiae]UII57459.1 polysaccharide deacetylase family protein [Cytobacillus spongiae]
MRKFVSIVVILAIAFLITNNSYTDVYVTHLKQMEAVAVTSQKDSLFQEIIEKAKGYEVEPVDAKVDPVWKAIPGYNGLKVDVKASHEKMKKTGEFDQSKLVFNQVPPKVNLTDLPPTPVYKGHPDKPMVSFIVNVAWGNEYLSDILATLKKHKVKVSFFLEGRWVQNNPELAKMIVDGGHEVGNHSFTHPDMQKISSARIREEIKKTNDVIEATTGKVSTWLAPPSGSYRDEVVQIAATEFKLGTVMWSVDTIDWRKPSPDELIQRVMSKVHNGALILMHPTASTANALDQLIIQLKAKKLQISTVSDLVNTERIIQK